LDKTVAQVLLERWSLTARSFLGKLSGALGHWQCLLYLEWYQVHLEKEVYPSARLATLNDAHGWETEM